MPTEVELRSKSGKYILGHIVEIGGIKIYLARRRHGQLFRSGCKSISGAMTQEICGWAIDENTLFTVRAKGCKFIGVRTIDTMDIYLAPMPSWFNRKLYKDHNYEGVGKGGSKQRLLYLSHFHLKKSAVQLDAAKLT